MIYLEMFTCMMWHSSVKVGLKLPVIEAVLQVRDCQQWAGTGCQQCDHCLLAWLFPSKLHREETKELSEVPVQLLGAFPWCSLRKGLHGVYWVFFRSLVSDLHNGISNSAFSTIRVWLSCFSSQLERRFHLVWRCWMSSVPRMFLPGACQFEGSVTPSPVVVKQLQVPPS